MSSRASVFNLNEHKIIKTIKEGLPETITHTQNIFVIKDDILYVWHSAENCILTLNIKTLETEKDIVFQRLLATESPSFAVDRILVNATSTLVCAAGTKGACLFRLPRRSGPFAQFQGGRESVLCKTQILDERFFMTWEIYQVIWHPASPTDSHLLILASDNTIRLYDSASAGRPLIKVWSCGRRTGPRSLPPATALGRSAVAITMPSANSPDSSTIRILAGDGDVYAMDGSLEDNIGNAHPNLVGPLRMFPPADDNYGAESCSILLLGINLLIVATCGGTLYHCLLLSEDQEKEKLNSSNPITNSLLSQSLYVIEAIELDLGLNMSDTDPGYTCPIYLTADEGVKNRYFCHHEAGVHIITVPFINQLDTYFNGSDDDIDSLLPTMDQQSTAEYIICTKTSKTTTANPPLGLGITYSPHALIALLADGRVVTKMLDGDQLGEMLLNDAVDLNRDSFRLHPNRSDANITLKEIQKVPFDSQIRQILKRDMSQPILKMSTKTEPTVHECFELLTRATHVFHSELFVKHEKARKEVEKRVLTLRLLKKHQLIDLEKWETGRAVVEEEALRLKDKCKEAWEKQQMLNKRCEKMLRALRQKQSVPSIAEREMSYELRQYQTRSNQFKTEMEKIKKKQTYQQHQMHNWDANTLKKEVLLGKNHSEIIKNTLQQQNEQIKEIIEQINNMKVELNLS